MEDNILSTTDIQETPRDKGWRKAHDQRAQQRQKRIARGKRMLKPGQDPDPSWRKQTALAKKSATSLSSNPRGNNTLSAKHQLTVAEQRVDEAFRQDMADLQGE